MRVLGPREVVQIKWGPGLSFDGRESRWYAKCDDCGWHCHTTPHKSEEVAERCMTRHVVSKHPPRDRGAR